MTSEYTVKDFQIGMRVQLHPATDLWMRGARYGTVNCRGNKLVHVHVDALNRVIGILPRDLVILDK